MGSGVWAGCCEGFVLFGFGGWSGFPCFLSFLWGWYNIDL